MNYYALQVKTRSEEKYIKLFNSENPDTGFKLHFPKRQLNIKKAGKIKASKLAVFPGYVFIESENEDNIINYQWKLKKIDGFHRFLVSNRCITSLNKKDMELVHHFISAPNSTAGVSKVYFNENNRIIVLEGVMAGLEGRIVKVDKRKGRAKIRLDLYDDSFTIDLAFEVISLKETFKKAS